MVQRKGKTWVETSVPEFLELSAEDIVIVEFRAALALALQRARKRRKITQEEAAESIGTSQAQVSKMEAGVASVTLDRMIKALTALGVPRRTIVRALKNAA
ncbi:MAG: XRE family transcriptional regulator [Planctomycetota bacterium]|nr:MAG: XRE family transcriptional regulator [Planctomycetota bacterium]